MYRVLIVDDEMYEREGIRRQLSNGEYGISQLDVAENGLAALKRFEAEPYDIVISDVKMPVMDGLTMALRMQDLSPDVKLLFFSGYEDFNFVKQAIQIHAYDYLLKPVGEKLVEKVQELIKLLDEKYGLEGRQQTNHSMIVDKLISIVQTRYMEDLTIKQIAEEVLYSPNYLSMIFKRECGMGFYDYLVSVRMKRAKQMLLEENVKIYQVANAVGYEDTVAFIKRFRREFGCTPAQFRNGRSTREQKL